MTPSLEPTAPARTRYTYQGEALRAVTLPLGGLGTGSVALAGDGGLRQWQIVNNVNHDAHVPHSFFAVWAGGRRIPGHAAVLQRSVLYDDADFRPAPSVTDHLVPAASRHLLADLPGVDNLDITAQYPIAAVQYHSAALPVHVQLEAFSPFIPLNSQDSGLPVVIFNFTLHNPHARPLAVSLLGAQQNIVGWDGKTAIDGVENVGYGGNVNTPVQLRNVSALDMGNVCLESAHPHNGHLALAALTEPEDTISTLPQWTSPQQMWSYFARTRGRLPERSAMGSSGAGHTWNGALAVHLEVAPGASRTVPFLLAWHFPNRYVSWQQSNVGIHDEKSRFWLGNQYNTRFANALAVVEYVRDNYDRLVEQTRQFRSRFYDSTLPPELLDSVAAPVSTLRTPTCLWNEDGRFHGFEGCHGASTSHGALEGCCPMNCTHVWNYEMALAKLFPDLEQGMRHTDLIDQMSPWGAIPHRTALPLYLPRPWDEFIGGPRNPAMDGELGTVLKAYREVRHGASREWFDAMWPALKKLMQHVMDDYDAAGDGVIRGEQPNTYDISIYGPNTFIGTLYLAALRAAEEMAKLQGEADLAARYHARFQVGRQNYDELCWNGEYYSQIVDLDEHTEQQFGTGCHIDQLLGQWWAFALDLGYVLPEDHVRTTLRNIYTFNWREGFRVEDQRPRVFADERDSGLYICTWPHGGKPDVPTQYSDEVWSGLEYPLAAMLLHEGETDAALSVLRAIRDRHDGTRRSPWNEVECGDHYVRPLASWTLLEEAAGYRYVAHAQALSFAPRLDADDFRSFFITGSGWGGYQQDANGAQLTLDYGSLALQTLQLRARQTESAQNGEAAAWRVQVDGRDVDAQITVAEGAVHIHFESQVLLMAGETLRIIR